MSAHKSIDKICIVAIAVTIIISVLFCNGQAFGIQKTAHAIGYENRLFDRSKVHKIDIVMDDWDGFIDKCESEEYSRCDLVIDGEASKNVGIRAKGNTSLSSVKNMDSDRYSFNVEFDQYDSTKSYHGLDKLCLNNIIQDNTYMKDYLAYTLMYDFGVDTPLCSFACITVNGDDWGLYLAVEAIEESFLTRNYGNNYGGLYKPDSMSFGGGGPGNGKDFSMSEFMDKNSGDSSDGDDKSERRSKGNMPNFGGGNMPDFGNGQMPDFANGEIPDFGGNMPDFANGEMPDFSGGNMPGGFGMGSDDVKLKYTDDSFDSYSNIFNNAKTTVNDADKKRLIHSLKALSEQSDLESTVDVEEVIRYFVVHNFLCNGDSYTGQMIHNYYLYEKNGQLSMIPWDYNLAYGSFSGGNASSSVNSPIDTPVSGDMSDRPMVSWIFDDEDYTEQYHKLFSEFLSSVDLEKMISDTAALIDEYVEKDPTKFCTYDEFKKGVEAISKFCTLRAESVSGQLSGSIPSTSDGQKADSSSLIDTGDLNISDMGSMNMGSGKGGFGGFGGNKQSDSSDASLMNMSNMQFNGGDMPGGFDPSNFDGKMPEDFTPPDGSFPSGKNEDSSKETATASEDATSPSGQSTSPDKGGRPKMDSFPSRSGNSSDNEKDHDTAYILLGISGLVLLLGLGFALKFRR